MSRPSPEEMGQLSERDRAMMGIQSDESSGEESAENSREALRAEMDRKIQDSLAEALATAQRPSDKEDITKIYQDLLVEKYRSTGGPGQLKELTSDNKTILEDRIKAVEAYAKLHAEVNHAGEKAAELKRIAPGSPEAQRAESEQKRIFEDYQVANAVVSASNLEILKYNDPKLEDKDNLRRAQIDIPIAKKYTDSARRNPFSKSEMNEVMARKAA